MDLNITTYIALYGAIISTSAIIWNILLYVWDKPKVKVSADFGFITTRDESDPIDIYNFSAVNKSKRPVTLKNAGIRIENNDNIQFVTNHPLPIKLEEGDTVSFYRIAKELNPELANHKIKYLWFRDSTGKEYKSKRIKKLFLSFQQRNNSNT